MKHIGIDRNPQVSSLLENTNINQQLNNECGPSGANSKLKIIGFTHKSTEGRRLSVSIYGRHTKPRKLTGRYQGRKKGRRYLQA